LTAFLFPQLLFRAHQSLGKLTTKG